MFSAEQLVRDGIRASPDHVQCLFILTVALFHQAERAGFNRPESQTKLREAVDVAAHAVAIKPDHGFAHLYRGLALKSWVAATTLLQLFERRFAALPKKRIRICISARR